MRKTHKGESYSFMLCSLAPILSPKKIALLNF